jgi:hopene-associated glycosyltransferase HpnB
MMFALALIAGTPCVIIWLYLLVGHARFWIVRRSAPRPVSPAEIRGTIAVVIPARNEGDVIGRAVGSLLRQSCAAALHIFVVDDHSTDGTVEAARRAASDCSQASRLTIISASPLPSGWTGKLWAVQHGIEQALLLQPDFLLLTDADIEHSPNNVAMLVSIADSGDYDLASFMVRLHCRSFAEKLLIPAFVFFFFMLYPPAWIRDSRRRTAGAAGGCMLIRPVALATAGGIEAIRQELIDDCALARAVKRSGGRVWLGSTSDTHSLRAYDTFAEIERMIARTAFNQLRHSALLLTGAVFGMLLVYLTPLVLLASGSTKLVAIGAVGYVMMAMAYLPMVRIYRLNPLWAVTVPFSAAFYTFATVHSALKYWSGRGGEWKGRAQDA